MKIFIGTSSEQKDSISLLKRYLREAGFESLAWTDAFSPGDYNLEALFRALGSTDGAIFLMSLDDKRWFRGKKDDIPRDNLVFEAGLWMSRYGRKNVLLVVPKHPKNKLGLSTDLSGLTVLTPELKQKQKVSKILPKLKPQILKHFRQISGLDPEPLPLHPEFKSLLSAPNTDMIYVQTIVGTWNQVDGSISKSIRSKDATKIDVLVAYQLRDLLRDARFWKNKKARVRICLSNMYDEDLMATYMRKYRDETHDETTVRDNFEKAIRSALNDKKAKIIRSGKALNRLTIKPNRKSAPKIEIFLTPQRVATSYYRINDVAWIIPLDAKRARDPAPMCWGLSQESSPTIFTKYADEFEAVIGEAERIYPKTKKK